MALLFWRHGIPRFSGVFACRFTHPVGEFCVREEQLVCSLWCVNREETEVSIMWNPPFIDIIVQILIVCHLFFFGHCTRQFNGPKIFTYLVHLWHNALCPYTPGGWLTYVTACAHRLLWYSGGHSCSLDLSLHGTRMFSQQHLRAFVSTFCVFVRHLCCHSAGHIKFHHL